MECNLCPRFCNINRENGIGFCGVGTTSFVATTMVHMWEEPFLSGVDSVSGKQGSGTIFFCGCNLRCIFCQNSEISTTSSIDGSIEVDETGLAELMLKLQEQNVNNINLVTPTPHIPLIARAIPLARRAGLTIPIAYNTNSYVTVEALKQLEGLVDIYMPDMKYVTPALARLVSAAENYPEYAKQAIAEMIRQCGMITLGDGGMASRGVVIRHLVLPGNIDETRRVLDYIAENYSTDVAVSLMAQYFPAHKAVNMPPFDRTLLKREYSRAVDYAISLGFTKLLIQEQESAVKEFVPTWGRFI